MAARQHAVPWLTTPRFVHTWPALEKTDTTVFGCESLAKTPLPSSPPSLHSIPQPQLRRTSEQLIALTRKLTISPQSPGAPITMAEQSINIPQVLVFLVVIFLASRWYLSKPSATHTTPNRTAARINPAQIDQIAQMFPQLSRRDIAWDLQRNGGNPAATTERVLGGRGLDTVSLELYGDLSVVFDS
jgi:hypothetical protein